MAASEWMVFLGPKVKAYQERVDEYVLFLNGMGATYDAVLTTETGRFRDTLIAKYNRDLPKAIADALNMEPATAEMQRDLDAGYSFLHQKAYDEFKEVGVYRDLDDLIRKGYDAIGKSKGIPQLRSLPDPLPDAVQPAEVVAIEFVDLGLKQGIWYPVEVTVKNNARYTDRHIEVEIRVRSGPAKIEGSTFRKVTVQPGATKVLTWRFMATDDGEFDFVAGARIVPPKL
jgi:hypothetical protein